MFNFVFLCPKRWFQFNSRIVRTTSIMTLNNWKMIAETRSYIFRWRSHFRRRSACLRSLLSLTLGNSRSYDGCRNENVTVKWNLVWLSGLRLFYVGNVAQNRRSALSLAWHEWFSLMQRQRMKGLLLKARVVTRISKIKISRRHLADYVKNCTKKRGARAARLFFPHATNRIIHLWRCRCCRHFLNSPFSVGRFRLQLACHFMRSGL